MKNIAAFAMPVLLLVSACNDEPEIARETGDAKEAEGEVLGGSISDDMLPLGELKSQSPPLKQAAKPADTAAADAADAPQSEEEAAPDTEETAAEPEEG